MLNKVMLIGNVGKDPEGRDLPNGKMVVNFSLATTETWKDKDSGEKKEATQWHNIQAFGPKAETLNKYVSKGSKLYIEGKVKYRSYENTSGVTVYRTEIEVQDFKFLSKNTDAKGSYEEYRHTGVKNVPAAKDPSVAEADDDIPF